MDKVIYMTGKNGLGGVYRTINGRNEVYDYQLDAFKPDNDKDIFLYHNCDYISEEEALKIMKKYREFALKK